MRKLSILLVALFVALICSSAYSQDVITLDIEKSGKIEKYAKKYWKKNKIQIPMTEVTDLAINGVITNEDIASINLVFPNLKILNMENATLSAYLGRIEKKHLDKFEVVYFPSNCKSIFEGDYYRKSKDAKLGAVNFNPNTSISSSFIPVIQIKQEGVDYIDPLKVLGLEIDSPIYSEDSKGSKHCGLLISSIGEMERLLGRDKYHRNSKPNILYDITTQESYLYNWGDGVTLDIMNAVNHLSISFINNINYDKCLTAFNCDTILLPSNIYSISDYLFHRAPIKCFEIESESPIKIIPKGCFFDCTGLESIILSDGIEEIQSSAFVNTSIKQITIPASVVKLNASAFAGCENLREIKILASNPPEITPIDMEREYYDDGITKYINNLRNVVINIPKGSYSAYSNSKLWSKLSLVEEGATKDVTLELNEPGTLLSKISIDDMKQISSLTIKGFVYDTEFEVFAKMQVLKVLDLTHAYIVESQATKNKKRAEEESLKMVFSLMGVAAEDSYNKGELSSIDYSSVKLLEKLINNSSNEQSKVKGCSFPNGYLSGKSSLEVVKLPILTEEIGSNAFSECVNLRSVELSNNIKTIGKRAFNACVALSEINFPSSITYIGINAFSGCVQLPSVDLGLCKRYNKKIDFAMFDNYSGEIKIPAGVETIKGYYQSMVSDSYMLRSVYDVTIPSSVKDLEFVAFKDSKLYFEGVTPPNAYRSRFENNEIYVPKGSSSAYYIAFGENNRYIEY